MGNNSYTRTEKGISLVTFPTDFTVIDLETTGLDTNFCDIIEVAGVKVRSNKVVDTFDSLINIGYLLDPHISELTGITDEMITNAPDEKTVLSEFLCFVDNDVVVGHNVHFDINFIYDNAMRLFNQPFKNNMVDTLRFSRRLFPELSGHRLTDMTNALGIDVHRYHRALDDCISTLSLYNKLYKTALDKYTDISSFSRAFAQKMYAPRIDVKQILPTNECIDIDHLLYNRECVFTGVLEKMCRKDAMQLVVNVGGTVANRISKKTNFLVLGNNDFCNSIKNGKSNKQKKAEAMKLSGQDIEILSEQTFYDLFEV